MEIANPIYDAAFKFLMEDSKAAKLIIGAITGFEIEEIELRPTEVVTDSDGLRQFSVYRLDLAAKVRTEEGQRLILIEIQKAKFYTDVMRFRRYLGAQYASDENCREQTDPCGLTRNKALPIFTIYILGHNLEQHSDIPVIKVGREYRDAATGKPLAGKDDFIESLSHDSAIIQIPALRQRRRNRLEQLLAIFDQAQINLHDHHILNIEDESYPEEYQLLLRRLAKAIAEKEVRQRMTVEDEIVSEFEIRDRRENELREMAKEAIKKEKEAKAREDEERREKEAAKAREKEAEAREKEAEAREKEAKAREKEAEAREKEAEAREKEANAREAAALIEIAELKRRLAARD